MKNKPKPDSAPLQCRIYGLNHKTGVHTLTAIAGFTIYAQWHPVAREFQAYCKLFNVYGTGATAEDAFTALEANLKSYIERVEANLPQ